MIAPVKVTLPSRFADTHITIPDENLFEVLRPNNVEPPVDEEELIDRALREPIGTGPLADVVGDGRGKRVCLVIEDLTRSAPIGRVLPRLLDELSRCGIRDEQIFGVMALGTHRLMTCGEIESKVGAETCRRIVIHNSGFLEPGGMTTISEEDGIPLMLDRRVAEADIRLGIGTIVPHPVGWSGGAKIIIPGVTGRETVAAYHLTLGLYERNEFGSLMTPARRMMEKWVGEIGLDFIVNCVVTPEKKLYRVVAGDFVAAHRQGVKFSREVYGVQASGVADVVIANGYPAEIDYWQAQKAFNSGQIVTRPGGEVILVAPCPEGIGNHHDLPLMYQMAREDPDRLVRMARTGEVSDPIAASSGLSKAIAIFKDVSAGIVCDTITAEQARGLGLALYPTAQAMIDNKIAENPRTTFTVITHGGYLLPLLPENSQ